MRSLDKELEEKKEEGFIREQSDARHKRTLIENENLRSDLAILRKELQYQIDKTNEVQIRLREAEGEARTHEKAKRDLEDKVQHINLAKDGQQEQILNQIEETSALKDDKLKIEKELEEYKKTFGSKVQRIDDLQQRLNECEKIIEDHRTEISINLKRQNELTFRYEEGSRNWDAIDVIRHQSMDQIIRPFLS